MSRCENYVRFSGTMQGIKNIEKLFAEMQQLGNSTGEGQYPSFFPSEPERLMYDIVRVYDGGDYFVNYNTLFYPNIHDILLIAQKYEVLFVLACEQPTTSIYEKYVYAPNKPHQHVRLDSDDLLKISWDLETYKYHIDDISCIFEFTCINYLLDKKLVLLDHLQSNE